MRRRQYELSKTKLVRKTYKYIEDLLNKDDYTNNEMRNFYYISYKRGVITYYALWNSYGQKTLSSYTSFEEMNKDLWRKVENGQL